jgi:hypothetical protein
MAKILMIKLKASTKYLCLLLLFSCSQPKTDDVVKDLITNHFKFLNAHNLDSIRTEYTDHAYITSPDNRGAQPGPLGADEVFHYTFFAYPAIQYLVNHVTVTDSSAVVQYEVRGGERANPKMFFMYKGCSIFRIRDAKIDTEVIYSNPKDTIDLSKGRMMR